jgi:hypothetical protein
MAARLEAARNNAVNASVFEKDGSSGVVAVPTVTIFLLRHSARNAFSGTP